MPLPNGAASSAGWHVFELADVSPRIAIAATVTSWDAARVLAENSERPLCVAEQAWRQMVAAGVAPEDPPDEVTII